MGSTRHLRITGVLAIALVIVISGLVGGANAATSASVTFSYYTDPSISFPTEIASGADGALWYPNRAGFSIGRISTTGEVESFATPPEADYPYGITAGPDGALWFTSSFAIGRITTSGSIDTYPFYASFDIVAGPDGALWFTQPGFDAIGRIDTSGAITNVYTDPSISQPFGITAGPDGALWYTNLGNNTIGRVDVDGNVSSYGDSTIDMPQMITAGSDGALWFTNWGNNSIGRITTAGVVSAFGDGSILSPFGITAGPDGALWFTTQGRFAIGRITTAGVVSTYEDSGIQQPWGITTGSDGAVWFTNANGTIGRVQLGPQVVVSGHGRFGTDGEWGRVDFTLSNEQVTFDRGTRFSFSGEVESVTGSGKEATLSGSGSWNGKSGHAFSVSVVDNAPWGVYKDTIDVVVRDPQGTIVLTSFGPKLLKQGDISVTPASG